MDAIIQPRALAGSISAIPSKSEAHRALICAALADAPTRIVCKTTSEDIEATISCLEALGATIERDEDMLLVAPLDRASCIDAQLDCNESGSTLRFMLPVAAALGTARIDGAGRLAQRPLEPLLAALRDHGSCIEFDGGLPLTVSGPLEGGAFTLPGNISSQFITGILLAAPLLAEQVTVRVAEPVESQPYIALTLRAMSSFGVEAGIIHEPDFTCYRVKDGVGYVSPGSVPIGGDWSNAAFWLSAGALSEQGILVEGLELASKQADRAVLGALALFGSQIIRSKHSASSRLDELHGATIDVASCPDLVPAIAPVAALAPGTSRITGAGRLRLKESDRLASISGALNALGARVEVVDDALVFEGVPRFHGGTVDAANDHRIAMMAAIAATRADGPVTVTGAECTAKSYPGFFDDYALLGGSVTLEA